MREHIAGRRAVRARGRARRARRSSRFRGRGPGLQGRADRGPRARPGRRDASASTRTARSPTSAAARTRPRTKRIKAFKLQSVAGAYWRGDASRPDAHAHLRDRVLLPKDLEEHLERLEQARARDHRKLGARARRCSCSATSSPGSPFWQPNGMASERAHRRCGARRTRGAATARSRRRSLRRRAVEDVGPLGQVPRQHVLHGVEDRPMGLKPMNCPATSSSTPTSAAPTATCRSATPSRACCTATSRAARCTACCASAHFTQDDAHIFCTEEQIAGRGPRLPRLRLRHLRPVRLRAAARALDAAGEAHRHRRDVGPRRGGARATRSTARASSTSSTRATARSTARRSTCT